MAQLEIFQNGTSLRPDRMGEPVFQIGTKNAEGDYDVVVVLSKFKENLEETLFILNLVFVPKESWQ